MDRNGRRQIRLTRRGVTVRNLSGQRSGEVQDP